MLGAVYKPDEVTVPHADPVQPAPATDHVTAVFVVLETVALNCCVLPVCTVALVGEIVTDTGGGVLIVTDAAADLVVSACDVARTVTVLGLGAVAGAV